ncbi:hypothetical protein ABK040_006435 [Willaertia magna]
MSEEESIGFTTKSFSTSSSVPEAVSMSKRGMNISNQSSYSSPIDNYSKTDKTEPYHTRFLKRNKLLVGVVVFFITLYALYFLFGTTTTPPIQDSNEDLFSTDENINNENNNNNIPQTLDENNLPINIPVKKTKIRLNTIEDYFKDFSQDSSNTRRIAVRDAFKHAFKGYEMVWGKDEFKPVTKGYHNWIRGSNGVGMTLIDAIDTMVIMGLKDEYKKSLEYVKNDMPSFSSLNGGISVFETTIRVLGGFLSAYDLTKEKVFLDKAKEIADRLVPSFSSGTGIPYSEVNLQTGEKKTFGWAGNCCPLSEFGTMQLEFRRLSELTGDDSYNQKVTKVMDIMFKNKPSDGLFPIRFHPETGNWCTSYITFGALGDSFYEYLLKQWLLNRGTKKAERYRELYLETVKGVFDKLLLKSSQGYTYIAEHNGQSPVHKVDHLTCFAAGMLALGGYFNVSSPNFPITNKQQIDAGAEFTRTCYETYAQSPSGIGPETFHFDIGNGGFRSGVPSYLLRPETVESIFIMYRVTGDEKYREWGWNIFKAIEAKCKISSGGYSGITNVNTPNPPHDDHQQSFFLAETLKYLYLLFCPNHVIPLDEWVINTEAHPLRVTKTEH